MDTVYVIPKHIAKANDTFRALIQEAKYPWVWRKLNNARLHMLRINMQKVEYQGQKFVTNGDMQ